MSKKKSEKIEPIKPHSDVHRTDAQPLFLQKCVSAIRHPWFWAGLIVIVLLPAIYASSIHSTVFFEREDSILHVSILAHAKNIPVIFSSDFLLFSNGQYRPISYALLALVRTIQPNATVEFWHGWLLAFHALNALLLFALVRRFTHSRMVPLIATLVFAVHPLATILVNDINCFYFLLGLTLSLGSLNSYLSFTRSRHWSAYVLSVVLFVLALGTARQAFVLGFILALYEILYERSNWKRTALQIFPYIVFPLLLLPICMTTSPHPLHFKYVEMYEGSFWHGLFSFVGATGKYWMGFLFAHGLYELLHESVQQIYSGWNVIFLAWALVNLLLIVGTIWALAKKKWSALGLLFLFVCMIPYASVGYNRVVEYVSWSYFYFPLAGFALFAAGLYERIEILQKRYIRLGLQVACGVVLVFWGGRAIQQNRSMQNPLDYWLKAIDANSSSQIALYETGKEYLNMGMTKHAIHFFFAPMTKDIKKPCLAMALYYCRTGEYLASAVHLRFGSSVEKTGMILEPHCEVGSELLLSAGALDHAEEQLGKLMMVNPYDTQAMARLSQVWFLKGFVGEARRLLDHIRDFNPQDSRARDVENEFRKMERSMASDPNANKIVPPSPDWLNYVMNQERAPSLRRDIVALSDRLTDDPVIQLEAAISLLEDESYMRAAPKMELVIRHLEGYAYACAVACRVYALAGEPQKAIQAGLQAISLESQNTLAWDSLALAQAQRGIEDEQSAKFMESVAQRPAIASVYFYNLGLKKKQAGLNEEALTLFEKAIAAKPDYFEANLELAKILVAQHQAERALEILQTALTSKTDNPDVYQYMGRAYLMLKETDKGLNALRTSVKIDPKNASYHYVLGFALESVERRDEAAEEYRRSIEINPNHADAHFKLGNYYFRLRDYPKASEQYQAVVRILPSYQYVHLNLSSVLHTEGKMEEAIREVEEEMKYNPKLPEAYDRMITFCCEKKDYERVRYYLDRAKELGLQLSPQSLSSLDHVTLPGNE